MHLIWRGGNRAAEKHDLETATANEVRTPIGDECNESYEVDSNFLRVAAGAGQPSHQAFQSLVGNLLWIARCTRPDIWFALHRSTRQTHNPTMKVWTMAEIIAHYLKIITMLNICVNSDSHHEELINIAIWIDASFAAEKSNRKSISGCVIKMKGDAVSCFCKKKTSAVLSTMKAELSAER